MPHEDSREYFIPLSDEDRLILRHRTKSVPGGVAEIIEFAVIYDSSVEGEWKTIAQYDCDRSLGKKPHRHIIDWSGKRGKVNMGDHHDASAVFNEAKASIRRDFKKLKEQYIISRERYE